MANLHISPLAQTDLQEIRSYIEQELGNPTAARNTISKILKSFRVLEQFPFSGTPLRAGEIDTGYRSVTSGNFRTFYRCNETDVYIIRILYGRRDYMRILFGAELLNENEDIK